MEKGVIKVMDASNRSNSDLTGLFKSWIPWRSEPAHVSRDFWMPDHSCRVCYECDSQFTFFNRRHHCRICGRIFCAKCTSNWLPTQPCETEASQEDWDTIRVCDYCYKQWKKKLTEPVENGAEVANLDFVSTSPSTNSFISVKSGETSDSSSCTFLSLSESSGHSPYQSEVMETCTDTQSVTGAMSNDDAMNVGEQNWSQNQFGPFQRRTQNEDEEFGDAHFGSSACPLSQVNGYFSPVQFDDMDNEFKSRKVHPDGDTVDSSYKNSSSLENNFDSQAPKEDQQIAQKDFEHDINDECEAPSSIYVAEDVNTEPVDFENNGVLWLPPEPEDEEDEREGQFVDDNDDENATGEWGYFRNSSFGNEGNRSRDKSNEEHKRAVKNVLGSHFRALVAQLLQVEDILVGDDNDKENWLEIIISLSWEAATLLKPDMSYGGQMDPGGYVKVKCIASGRRSESMAVKGVVCKKNVAHRRMTSKVEKVRLLILGGALEYQRVPGALSSIDTLLQQEMDHLKMAVAKIDAHNPDVLLVEKSVSRYAQEYLLEKDISLVLNIKRPLLERIARCTGGQIVPSIDQLSSPKLGHCDMFHVEKFHEQHGTAGQNGKKLMKTLMYFEGCPKPLGCTILLRGANGDELKKVKHVIQYGVFAAYHLALETSFLADEGASLPILPLNTPITVALPDKPSSIDRSISTIPGFTIPINEMTSGSKSIGEPLRSNSMPTSELVKAAIASMSKNAYDQTSKLPVCGNSHYTSASSNNREDFQPSSSNEPSLHRSSEDHTDFLTSLEGKVSEADTLVSTRPSHISNEFMDSNVMQSDCFDVGANRSASNSTSVHHDGKHTLEEQPTFKEEFSATPADNQSILVSLSSRCVWKGTVCERSHLFRIKYYGSFDKPLGRYLRDQLFDQNYRCPSCDLPAEAHVQCYTHRQGTLTISVKKLQDTILPGEKDGKIWMWHRCLKCPRANGFPPATWRVVMSDAAWGLSLGKFLELSFSNHAAASRVASCGHSLHRDCLRFYGFGKMVACFRYASIDVHSVYLPPSVLGFNYESQEWIEKELNEVVARAELLFSQVLNALRLLVERKSGSNLLSKAPESRSNITNLDALLQKEKSDFEESLQKILNKEADQGQRVYDILELNQLHRQLMFQSYVWDQRLINADSIKIKSQSDDIAVALSETVQEPPTVTEKPFDTTIPVKLGETLGGSANITEDAKHDQSLERSNHLEVLNQKTDSGHLSDTLDAVSTDASYPSEGISKRSNLSESPEADKASAGATKKLDVEEHSEDGSLSIMSVTPSFVSSSDNMEVPASWLGMSFMSLYKSLNKSLSGSAQKLDKFIQYNPIYISSFRDSGLQCGARFLLPVGVNDTIVPVFDDEPTSVISYALLSPDYFARMSDKPGRPIHKSNSMLSMQFLDFGNFPSFQSLDDTMLESYRSFGSVDEGMLFSTNTHSSLPPASVLNNGHTRVTFTDDGPLGKVKYTVICYYAKDFESLRALCCPSEMDFIRSLSRCKKWGAQGGKSNVFFAKTLDDRFIIKQVTKTELESFIKFGPRYFNYLTESINTGSPTCLAKILGIYQVTSKHLKGGKETKMDMLVMENLLYRRNVTRLYDLKGSSRSRYNPDSSGSNKVLLDQNLIEAMPTAPIFVGNKAKRLLERAVWNDAAFLASIDVMDYSLLVGVDEEKHELVLGIIDFMRQYTWDKHLETWVKLKASGILGGPKNASPTVISPKQYKTRFRKAMTTYFLMVPDQWSPATIIPSKSQADLREENITQHISPAE